MHRIALLTHTIDGGVWSTTRFLQDILHRSGRYTSDVIVLATSAHDPASVRLLAPDTWRRGVSVLDGHIDGNAYRHVGAVFSELEFQRYLPRKVLTDLLNQYDLVQVVAGGPAWAFATKKCNNPVALQVATLASVERSSIFGKKRRGHEIWQRFMTQFTTFIERRALDCVDVIFVMNAWMFKLLSEKYVGGKITFAPPGIDVHRWKPKKDVSDGYILSVSRLDDPRKNVRMILMAYQIIRSKLPTAPRLVLVGHTGLSAEDSAYSASVGLTDYIDIYTNVGQEDLRKLYQNAGLFVLSSNEEGLGIVILEAMASGLPVVSTDCVGPATAIVQGETGFLTPVKDGEALADAIQTILKNPELGRKMGLAGRKRIEEYFSLASTEKLFLDKYDELLD